jgi:hypothetical protein
MGITVQDGRLKGAFKGFRSRDTIFEFTNGSKWRQARYRYLYRYAYRPEARVVDEGGTYMLYVDGMDESIEVRRA